MWRLLRNTFAFGFLSILFLYFFFNNSNQNQTHLHSSTKHQNSNQSFQNQFQIKEKINLKLSTLFNQNDTFFKNQHFHTDLASTDWNLLSSQLDLLFNWFNYQYFFIDFHLHSTKTKTIILFFILNQTSNKHEQETNFFLNDPFYSYDLSSIQFKKDGNFYLAKHNQKFEDTKENNSEVIIFPISVDLLEERDKELLFPLKRESIGNVMMPKPNLHCSFLQRLNIQSCEMIKKNNQNNIQSKIPKIIHSVWVGKQRSPPFDSIRSCIEMNVKDGWQYWFWTDDVLERNLELFNSFQIKNLYLKFEWNFVAKADLLRWELLHRFGGVWIDADTVCHRPLNQLFNEIQMNDIDEQEIIGAGYHSFGNPWVAYLYHKESLIATNIVYSTPRNVILSGMLSKIQSKDLESQFLKNPAWIGVGPLFFTNHLIFNQKNHHQQQQQQNNVSIHLFPFYYFVPIEMRDFAADSEEHKQLVFQNLIPFANNLWDSTKSKSKPTLPWNGIPNDLVNFTFFL